MRTFIQHRLFLPPTRLLPVALCLAAPVLFAQNAPVVLDRVLVVVNQQPILQSDLDRELRLAVLDPNIAFSRRPQPSEALDRIISRTLILQQLAQQPPMETAQLQQAVDRRMNELRAELPACVRLNCNSAAGWQAFLNESKLTAAEIGNYIRQQVLILDFIEKRFRPGIHITADQIAAYYRISLLPQYSDPKLAPQLDAVSTRIAEILLEQQVNLLLEDWLATLRKDGDLEFLDRSYEPTVGAQ